MLATCAIRTLQNTKMQDKIIKLLRRIVFYLQNKERLKILPIRAINWLFYRRVKAAYLVKRAIRKAVKTVLPETSAGGAILLLSRSRQKYLGSYAGARWYVKKGLDIESFFSKLHEAKANYVVLRWFEDLPHIAEGEDIDILVSDRDLEMVRGLCEPYENGGQKLDIYSVSGRSGSDYEGAAYYPSRLSQELLETRRVYKQIFSVPSDDMYFVALAYHAVFHKGKESGLPFSKQDSSEYISDHKYPEILKKMALSLDLEIDDFSFSGYYHYLERKGYVPELDTIRLLSRPNQWLREFTYDDGSVNAQVNGEVVVFIIREWAIKNDKINFIEESLQASGFDILLICNLDHEASIRTKENVRGGQWGKGPYPVSGGDPAAIIVCFDYVPVAPSESQKDLYPHLSNSNILVKHKIRDAINRDLIFYKHVNCIHSADDEAESWKYLQEAVPECVDDISVKVGSIRNSGYFHGKQIKHVFVENGTRAKTELIEYDGELCVLKTYKPGRERFLEREAYAYQEFSSKIQTVPPLIKRGTNYIITSYYKNVLDNKTEDEARRIVRGFTAEILDTMKLFYDNGYAILGFYPGNLIVTTDNHLKIIDFEFLYEYKKTPASFSGSYDVVGVPAGFSGDLPRGDSNHTIKNTWKDYLDMSLVAEYLKTAS